MSWRTITAQQYVDNSDPDGFDEAHILCPDGRVREVWDAGYDEGDPDALAIVVHTSLPDAFAVTRSAPVRVR
jgi:hypothetical protein